MLRRPATLLAAALALPLQARAESLTGLCPDGSAFVVQSPSSIPCPRAKLVPASELPPLRPELLPKPYSWHVDQESSNPNNPYNLLDDAQRLRALRSGEAAAPQPATATALPTGAESAPAPRPAAPLVALDPAQSEDLARVVALRQRVAPAEIRIDDVHGRERLVVQFAHSPAFESLVLGALGTTPAQRRVLAYSARAVDASEFHPTFLVVQGSTTFRPDPEDERDVGLVLGSEGELPPGTVTAGYLVVPARFDPARPLELWWNDHRVEAVLKP